MADKFKVYSGKFTCQNCGLQVSSMRFWFENGDVTWMCSEKHLSKVSLIAPKKRKKDFSNE